MNDLDPLKTNQEKPTQFQKTFFRSFWWIGIIILILLVLSGKSVFKDPDAEKGSKKEIDGSQTNESNFVDPKKEKFPDCPSSLSGILTHPIIKLENIGAIGPLGWVGLPGHAAPTDHNSFAIPNSDSPIPGYAPADGWISRIIAEFIQGEDGAFTSTGYLVIYTICEKVYLKLTSYGDLSPAVQKTIDEIPPAEKNCTDGFTKIGYGNSVLKFCYFETRIPLKAGDLIGNIKQEEGRGGTYEVWAYDYRKINPNYNENLKFYSEGGIDIVHSFCLFDMYEGDLKDSYYDLFGWYDWNSKKITKRTGEPLCGTHHQEIPGSIQGTWFTGEHGDIAIIHDDITNGLGMISVGDKITDPEIYNFIPVHSGIINREPSEVHSDGKIYCYDITILKRGDPAGKILAQLLDEAHLKAEHQNGVCGAKEEFKDPFTFDR